MSTDTKNQDSPQIFSHLRSNRFEHIYPFTDTVIYGWYDFDKMTDETRKGESFIEVDYTELTKNPEGYPYNSYMVTFGVKVKSISEFMNKVSQRSSKDGSVIVVFNLRTA